MDETQNGPMWIICDLHPSEFISCYCQTCQVFICMKCMLNHNAHINTVVHVTQEEIKNFCDHASQNIDDLVAKAKGHKACLSHVSGKSKTFKGSEFKETVQNTVKLLASPFLIKQQDLQHLNLKWV